MKYSPRLYAKAFQKALSYAPEDTNTFRRLISSLKSLLIKTGDIRRAEKVIDEIERLLIQARGGRRIVVETARKQKPDLEKRISFLGGERDSIIHKINPSLIAGMRIVADGELEFDVSLKKKLEHLF